MNTVRTTRFPPSRLSRSPTCTSGAPFSTQGTIQLLVRLQTLVVLVAFFRVVVLVVVALETGPPGPIPALLKLPTGIRGINPPVQAGKLGIGACMSGVSLLNLFSFNSWTALQVGFVGRQDEPPTPSSIVEGPFLM